MCGRYTEQLADNLVWQLSGHWRSNKLIIHRGVLSKMLITCIRVTLVREAVSNKIFFKQLREEFNYYISSGYGSKDDLECIDKCIEKCNFIRSLRWLFDRPQKKLAVGDFLTVKNFNEYKRLKLKFAWDKEAEQKSSWIGKYMEWLMMIIRVW